MPDRAVNRPVVNMLHSGSLVGMLSLTPAPMMMFLLGYRFLFGLTLGNHQPLKPLTALPTSTSDFR